MDTPGDSIVLEEEIDPNYEPTEREVQEYASWLGMDLETEQDLFWIAREGLKAPLPENWKPCKTTDTEEIYYFNFSTGQSTWDHPCDEYYRKIYDDHKKRRSTSRGPSAEGDERKKKEVEDVAELLGKKGSGKKKKAGAAAPLSKAAESLGPPVLGRGGGLGEKKPLPGLSTGKLGRLPSSGSLGSVSSLKPVSSLGRLKSEAKDDGDSGAVGLADDDDDEDEVERKPSPRALSKPPLGSLLSKKPLPSAALSQSSSKVDTKAELEEMTSDLEKKKQKLVDEQAKALRMLEEDHESAVSSFKKRAQKEMEDLQEQEETRIKQRKRELDKKINDMENQCDKDESNLLRERKEKLKRLENEMEFMLAQKKQELDRDQQKEIQRMQSRHDAKLQEMKEELERQENQIKVKGEAVNTASELAKAVEKLKSELENTNTEMTSYRSKFEAADKENSKLEQQLAQATKRAEESEKALADAKAVPTSVVAVAEECGDCRRQADRVQELEKELTADRGVLKEQRETVLSLQSKLEQLQQELKRTTDPKPGDDASNGSANEEVTAPLREAEADLRRALDAMNAKHDALVKELSASKSRVEELEQTVQQQQAAFKQKEENAAAKIASLVAAQSSSSGDSEALDNLRSELADLHDQVSVLTKTNAQIKDQLLKEANEKKQLREQLDTALASDDSSTKELSRKIDQLQRELNELEMRSQAEIASKYAELQAISMEKQAVDQEKRRLEADITRMESEKRSVATENTLLKRQMDEQLQQAAQAGDAAEQQASATVTKQKWEIEQLQGQLKIASREKEELADRVQQLQEELDETTRTKHQVELERDSETTRSKKKDVERETLQQKLKDLQSELEEQTEKTRSVSVDNAELKSQLTKLKFKEQAATEKLTHLEEDLKQLEMKTHSQQNELERFTRELRAKSNQLDEKTGAVRDLQSEIDMLNEQLSDSKSQLADVKARAQGPGSSQSQQGGLVQASGELAELRLRVSELDAKVESLMMEKSQFVEKHRALTQKQIATESSLRSIESERDRLTDECQIVAQEMVKWKERLEKKAKEIEQLKSELFSANSEKDLLETMLAKERDEKREVGMQKTQLDKAKKQLEAQVESLTAQLHDLETSNGRTHLETQTHQSKLKRLESELDSLTRELRATQDERDTLTAKLKQQATEMTALETRVRLLRNENNEQTARAKQSEDDISRHSETLRRLEVQLDDKEAKLRKEIDEKESLVKQMVALRGEKEELESELLSLKRKAESVEARCKDHETAASRGDFQLKLRVQQLEAERDGFATGRERADQHVKSLEKELLQVKDELGTVKSELDTARTRVKALTLEKDEIQTALLQAQSSQAASASAFTTSRMSSGSNVTADAMLVRLQLADVNRSELEHHLADIATQLELATRRCTLAESRCRDQGIEMESLHVEIASLRSSMGKMHLSALETLPLVERLEYEHRKRTLKRDFAAQLRDFQEREEHAVLRQKARLRAQHEKLLDEVVGELETKKQRRVEYEEQLSGQLLEQMRIERDVKAKAMRKQLESELTEIERELVERQKRRLEEMKAELRKDEDDARARHQEERQVKREAELVEVGHDRGGFEEGGHVSPGQVASTQRHTSRRRREKLHGSESDSEVDDEQKLQALTKVNRKKEASAFPSRSKTRHSTVSRGRSNRHEREIATWRKRLSDETQLLDKARNLLTDQKQQLKIQAEKIKSDKRAWKAEWAETGKSHSGHRASILQEMKTMIDHSASSWNGSMLQLREREAWIEKREVKLRKMKRALRSLKGHATRSRSRSKSGGRKVHSRSAGVRFHSDDDSGSVSSFASDEEGDDNQDQSDGDSDAVLDKLARLDGELASDASEFSSEDYRTAAWAQPPYQPQPSAYAYDRDRDVYSSYRYPISTAQGDSYVPVHRHSEPLLMGETSSRLFRSPAVSVRPMASATGSRREWTPSGTASRLPYAAQYRGSSGGGASGQTDAAVQRRIARWAHGRETLQHAATKQASWISSLCREVKAYGDSRAHSSSEAAPVAPLDRVLADNHDA